MLFIKEQKEKIAELQKKLCLVMQTSLNLRKRTEVLEKSGEPGED